MRKTIEEIYLGESMSYTKTFTKEDTEDFARITGDFNVVHMDEEFAKATIFKDRIVHGIFVSSMYSKIFGMDLPGVGSIYVKQSLSFRKPVYFGDTLTALVTVSEIKLDRNRVVFDCVTTNQRNEVVLEGSAELMPPKKEA